jgi:hypothetical protein
MYFNDYENYVPTTIDALSIRALAFPWVFKLNKNRVLLS